MLHLACAVEHDVLSGHGSCLSPGASAYQEIISNNSYAHDKQEVNPRQEKESLTHSHIKQYSI